MSTKVHYSTVGSKLFSRLPCYFIYSILAPLRSCFRVTSQRTQGLAGRRTHQVAFCAIFKGISLEKGVIIIKVKLDLPHPPITPCSLLEICHTKRMAENPIQCVWERPEIEALIYYLVFIHLQCRFGGSPRSMCYARPGGPPLT